VVINGDGECSTVAASLGGYVAHADRLGLKVGGCMLHSSNEPGKLSQWQCHCVSSTTNIVVAIIITAIVITCTSTACTLSGSVDGIHDEAVPYV